MSSYEFYPLKELHRSFFYLGPHLHYELRIDNKPINPLKAKLPRAAPVAKVERTAFKSWAKTLSERLDLLTGA